MGRSLLDEYVTAAILVSNGSQRSREGYENLCPHACERRSTGLIGSALVACGAALQSECGVDQGECIRTVPFTGTVDFVYDAPLRVDEDGQR